MGFLARIFGTERRDAITREDIPPSVVPYLPLLPPFAGTILSSPDEAVSRLAVAARCISLISEGLASLPLALYRRMEDGGRELVEGHPLHRLLNDAANDRMSSVELRESVVRDLCTYGNGFVRIVLDGRGAVAELHWLPYRMTSVERLRNGHLRYRHNDPVTGANVILLEDEVAHLRVYSKDGVMGVSPLMRAVGAVGLAMRQVELAETMADRGFVPDMVFSTKESFGTGEMANEAFGRLREQLSRGLRTLGRGPMSLLLEAGLEPKPLAAPGREQQFVESRIISLEDIARIYGVPLSVIGLGRQTSYGSLTEESRALRQNCFSPWARRVEAQLQLSLLTKEGRRQFVLEHDLSGLERGDLKARMETYEIGVRSEIISPDEARLWEGMNRRPDGRGGLFRNPAVQPTAEAQQD